jgi:glycosyltransferase involved in cell wall biosynthesis
MLSRVYRTVPFGWLVNYFIESTPEMRLIDVVVKAMKPRFSILIPTYNRKRLVLQTIESVIAQTFTNYEIFVIDDGSNDGTQHALRSYMERIILLQQANQGPEVARNLAARKANGDYLVLLDSDDMLMPRALETYDQVLRNFNSPPVLIGSMLFFNDGNGLPKISPDDNTIEFLKYSDYLSKDVPIGLSNSRIVVRKSLYEKVGGARNSSPTTFHCDDYHLILKIGTYGPCIVVLNPITVAYRWHDSNSVRSVKAMGAGIRALIRSEHKGEYPGGVRRKCARYACIGGLAQLWVRKAWKARQYRDGLSLLLRSFPMIAGAVCKKIISKYLQKLRRPQFLTDPMEGFDS